MSNEEVLAQATIDNMIRAVEGVKMRVDHQFTDWHYADIFSGVMCLHDLNGEVVGIFHPYDGSRPVVRPSAECLTFPAGAESC